MADVEYRVGTASWADRSLLATDFYPRECSTAEARLRFYAAHFDTVEVDSTYYALPSERNATLWAERTPSGFTFHVKAFAWLTLHDAESRALPLSIRDAIGRMPSRPRIPAPSEELRELAFDMFLTALQPLREAGKLGCLLFQYPRWFTATDEHRAEIARCRQRCAGNRVAVELRHRSWFGPLTEDTLDLLRRHDLVFVSVDAPAGPGIPPSIYAASGDLAYVRFHGRNRKAWFQRGSTAATRYQYLYSTAELRDAAASLRRMPGARSVTAIFNNCYGDYGVRNAASMKQLLGG